MMYDAIDEKGVAASTSSGNDTLPKDLIPAHVAAMQDHVKTP